MQWSREQLLKFPISAIFAGVAAGLVGIGGGMVIGPLFMMINLEIFLKHYLVKELIMN